MAEYMHLIGTEQIQSAANTMSNAAHEMRRAANIIQDAVHRHGEIIQELLEELRNSRKG